MKSKWHDVNKVPGKWKCPSKVTIIISHNHMTLRLSISKIISPANRPAHTREATVPHRERILR